MKYNLYKALWVVVWTLLIRPFPRASASKLVEEKFTAESVARQMHELYEWILGKKEKPKFIYE